LHGKIDTKGYRFELHMADIAELNTIVEGGGVDISKISYATYPLIEDKYQILTSGSALGRGNGPLLVSKKKIYPDEVPYLKIGIPGKTTTAAMLLKIAFGDIKELREYLFSDISSAIEGGEVDAGVLIHEERFLYREKGLHLISDLGAMWEEKSGLATPLGAIVIRRDTDVKVKKDINSLVANSVKYAFDNPLSSFSFVRDNAKELDEKVMKRHIEMFVNQYSLNLGAEGQESVERFF
ncbi:MAG: 1,4-dihydroxy-6-naphthoate synthase, partial [Rikenellaceae bacterium]